MEDLPDDPGCINWDDAADISSKIKVEVPDVPCPSIQECGPFLFTNTSPSSKNSTMKIEQEFNEYQLKEEDLALSDPRGMCSMERQLNIFNCLDIPDPNKKLFGCTDCGYRTKYKHCLKKHVFTHKKDDELDWFHCPECSYKTKYKHSLKVHSVTHKSEDETEWFDCINCSFKTKRKTDLKSHSVIHTADEETTWLYCTQCIYKTKRKTNLKKHSLIHKEHSEVDCYVCTECGYKTKRKDNLNKHLFIHKNEEELTWFNCMKCKYKTKYKHHLKKHDAGVHKDFETNVVATATQ